jgi:hypothetical protein
MSRMRRLLLQVVAVAGLGVVSQLTARTANADPLSCTTTAWCDSECIGDEFACSTCPQGVSLQCVYNESCDAISGGGAKFMKFCDFAT